MPSHRSTTTALAVVLGFAASVAAQSQQVQSEPPVEVANPGTKLDITPAGTPIINIAKPRDDGTSYNVFKRFNVGAEGLIFNNSPILGSTVLGGQILANPNLIRSGTSAKLILNEVIGGKRSDLNGPVEIFGPKAGVVIANAAGITCDGCGFFNVERVALSTGRVVFGADGSFSGLAVDGGAVDIKGKGLLAGNVDYFDIIAATTTLNASLYARDLVITGGNSTYDFAARTATGRGGVNPQLAIDSSLLGGMYANRIRLIGTGAGVGVNLQGVATALEGPLQITADGNITVKSAVAAGDANFKSLSGSIRIDESLYAGGQASIDAAGNIVQSGDFVAAAKDVSLKSGSDITLGGSALYAGLSSDGRLSGAGAISITATGAIEAPTVQAIATNGLSATADNITFGAQSSLSASEVAIEATNRLSLQGELQSLASISASAAIIDLSGAAVANGALALTARQLTLRGDAIGVGSATAIVGDAAIIEDSGSLQSNGAVTLESASIDNKGRVLGVGAASVNASGNLDNTGGILSGDILALNVGGDANISGAVSANGATNVTVAGTASVSGAIASASNLKLFAQSLALSGTFSSGGNLDMQAQGAVDTAITSIIAADGNVAINAGSIAIGGYTSAAGSLNIASANVLGVGGQLHAGGDLALSGSSLTLNGKAVTNADARLTTAGAAILDGTLSADGALQLEASALTTGEASLTVAAGNISAIISGDIAQQGAISGNAVSLTSGSLIDNTGSVYAADNLTLSASTAISNSGALESNGAATLAADSVTSNGNLFGIGSVSIAARDITLGTVSNLQSGGTLLIDANGALQTDGSILSIGTAELKSTNDFRQGALISLGDAGRIFAGGHLLQNGIIKAGGQLDLSGNSVLSNGALSSNGAIRVRGIAGRIDLTGDVSALGGISLDAPDLILLTGTIETDGMLQLTAPSVTIGGSTTALGGITAAIDGRLSVTESGKLRSGQGLSVDLLGLDNAGLISASNMLAIRTADDLNNSGQLIAGSDLSLVIGRDLNQNGLAQAGSDFTANVTGVIRAGGSSVAAGRVDLAGQSLAATGVIASDGALNIATSGGQEIASGALLFSKASAALTSGDTLDLKGQLTANGGINVQAANTMSVAGLLESGGNVALTAAQIVLPGNITALGSFAGVAQTHTSLTGNLSAVGTLSLSADAISAGVGSNIAGDGNVDLIAMSDIALDGVISAGGTIEVRAGNIAHLGQTLGGSAVSFLTGGSLIQDGLLQAGGSMLLNSASLALAGTTIGLGDIALSGNTILVSGGLTANGAITTDSDSLTINGSASSQNGITATAQNDILLGATGLLETNGALALIGRDIDLSGRAVGGTGVSLLAQRALATRTELLSGGNLIVSVGASGTLAGLVSANGTTEISIADSANVVGNLTSLGNLAINANDIVLTGQISGDGAVALNALNSLDAAATSVISADGYISFVSSGDVTARGAIGSASDVSFQSAGALALAGISSAGGSISGNGSAILASGSLIAVGDITLGAANAATLGGTISSGGDVVVDATTLSAAAASITVAVGQIDVTASGVLDSAGVISGSAVSLTSGSSLDNSGNVFGDSALSLSADALSNGGSLASNGALTLTARDIALAGSSDMQAGGVLNIAASGQLDTSGIILAIGAADISGIAGFNQNAVIELADTGRFASNGSLLQNGLVEANGALALFGHSIEGTGELRSSRSINFSAGAGGIDYTGDIAAVTGLSFAAPNSIRLAGTVGTDGVVDIDTGILTLDGNLTAAGGITARNLAVLSIGSFGALRSGVALSLNVADFVNAGLVAASGTLDLTVGGRAENIGTLLSGDALQLTVGGPLSNSGIIQAGTTLSAMIGGNAALGGTMTAIEALSVTANDITATGLIGSNATAALTAVGDLTQNGASTLFGNGVTLASDTANLAGTISSDADLTINSVAQLSLNGLTQSSGAMLLSGGSIGAGGSLVSLGTLGLSSAGELLVTGSLSSAGVTILNANALRVAISGKVVSGSSINANAASLFDNQAVIGANGAINIVAPVIGNSGSLISDGAIALTGNSVSSNILLADGTITLQGAGAVVINGDTSAQGAVSISSSVGTVNVAGSGSLRSETAGVVLSAAQGIGNAGTIVGETGISATSGATLINNGVMVARGGTLALTAAQLNLGGTVYGLNALTLSAPTINVTGSVGGENALSLTGNSLDIATGGLLQSNQNSTLNLASLGVSGTLRTIGNLGVTSSDGITVNSGGLIETGGTLGLAATGALANAGQIASQLALTLSGSTLNLGGVTSSATTANLGGGALTVTGLVETGGQLTVGNSRVTVSGGAGILRTASGIGITTGALNNSGTIEATGVISATASTALATTGTVRSNSAIVLSTSGAAEVGGNITAVGNLSVTGGVVDQSGTTAANGNVTLTSNSGGLNVSGAVVSQQGIALNAAGQSIGIGASAELFGQTGIAAFANNVVNQGTLLSPGSVTLNAAGTLSHAGQITAGNTASLTGGGAISLLGGVDAGAIALLAPIIDVSGILLSAGAVGVTSSNAVTVSGRIESTGDFTFNGTGANFTITPAGRVVSGSNVILGGVNNLDIGGLLSAYGNLSATYAGTTNVSGRVESGSDMTLASTVSAGMIGAQTLSVPGNIVAGRDLTIIGGANNISGLVYGARNVSVSSESYTRDGSFFTHSLDLIGSGTLASGGNLSVNVIGDLNVGANAAILAGGNGSITAFTNRIEGDVIATGALTFANRDDLLASSVSYAIKGFQLIGTGSAQSGGALSITVGGGRDVSIASGSFLISNDSVSVSGTNIFTNGTVAAGDLVSFNALGGMDLGGLIQSGRRISANAGDVIGILAGARIETLGNAQAIAIARDQGANANISLIAGNALTNSGTIYSDGSIFLQAEESLTNLGTVTGLTSVVTQSQVNSVNNYGTITGQTLGIFQNTAFFNNGSYIAQNSLLIDAPRIINAGLIGAGNNLTLNASADIVNTGTLFAGGNLNLNAGTQFHNDQGLVLALGNIAITAPTVLNDSARIESLGGDVTINSANVINRIKDLVIVPGGGGTSGSLTFVGLGFPRFVGSFSPADCGIQGPGGGIPLCNGPALVDGDVITILYSVGVGSSSFTEQYIYNAGTPATGTISANSGPSQIVAADNVIINGGANGVVTNRNSSILAGGNINITTGTLNNESTTVQTAAGQVLLPAIIRAGGTVSITAAQINNGTIGSNGSFNSSTDTPPNTGQTGANALGGRDPSAGTGSQNGALNGTVGTASGAGPRGGNGNGSYGVGYGYNNAVLNNGASSSASQGNGGATAGKIAVAGGNSYVDGGSSSIPIVRDITASNKTGAETTGVQLVDGYNGLVVGIVAGSSATAIIGADSSLNGGTAPAGQQPADLQNVDAVFNPDAAATSGNGNDAAAAALLDGFNGIAIPGVIGTNGEAGSFVFDFLRQFQLVGGNNGELGFLNGNGLFTYNDSPDADFLFSTNRGFDDLGGLFDSDYFFDQLDVDRGTRFTRLGDGFFESQLIGQQVRAATSQAQLPQYGDTMALAEALMASAVNQQSRLNLSVGVALTGSQVSALTQSLVWWVSASVNGRNVLVPVVYLAAADQKAIAGGAIIAGTNVVARVAGDIRNTGTISGANLVSLTAGSDIVNAQGGLIAGGTIVASAARDILNGAGSAIAGGDVLLGAGRDIVLSAALTSQTTASNISLGKGRFTSQSSTTQGVTGSSVSATGNLVMNAGRDVTITAGTVSAGGDAAILAGRDVTVAGVTTTDSSSAAWKTGKYTKGTSSSSTQSFTGSSIAAGGNLSVGALGSIGVTGSDITAGGDIALQAGQSVTIGAAQTTSTDALNERVSKRIKVNASNTTTTTNTLSNVVAGGNLSITTPGAVSIAGANLAAGNVASVNAGSVNITGVVDQTSTSTNTVNVKKGFLSKKTTTVTTSGVDQSVIGSTVEGERVLIGATGNIDIKGSTVVGERDVALNAGGAIDIGTLVEEDSSSNSVKVKKSGLSFSGTSLFVGVSKNANTDSATSLINRGSLIGSATGNVTLNADGAVNIIGSKVVSPGVTNIIGDSVTIANATDLVTGVQTSKSSSIGVTATISSPLISSLQALSNMAKTAAGADSSRTAAVAGVAGGLAAANAVDAIKDIGSLKELAKDPTSVFNVSVTAGFSKSSSRTDTTDQIVVGSVVTGGDVNIVARGNGGGEDSGAVNITGSTVEAQRDLMIAGTKAITVEAAQETDTSKSKNTSSGFSAGVVFGANGISPTVSANVGKGKSSGTDVTNIESQLIAGGSATIVTPDALVLRGGTLDAEQVNIRAGSLTIESLQDTSDFASKQTSIGLTASLDASAIAGAKPTGSIGGSFNQSKEKGNFASVVERSGIFAGEGGFDIQVAGATTLTGGVIDSEAEAARNRLATGTLSATDIINREKYSGSQIGFSGSLSGIGGDKGAGNTGAGQGEGGSATAPGKNGNAANGAGSDGSTIPGIHTGIGTIAAGVPVVLGASGGQTGTTHSAIAPGAIIITPGADGIRDAASEAIANVISRDTAGANDGALIQEFDEAKRAEIAKGFEAAKTLTEQTAVFFNNRAADQRAKEEEAAQREKEAKTGIRVGDDGMPIQLTEAERQQARDDAHDLRKEAEGLKTTFGPGSPIRLIATALSGAAGGNVSGSLGSFVKSAAVNVLQGLAVQQVKTLVDGIGDSTTREATRGALQAMVACAGAAAGSGDCGSAALGAAASVALNNLINALVEEQGDTNKDGIIDPLSAQESKARVDLITTIVAGIAAGAGLDPGSAATAAQLEIENNGCAGGVCAVNTKDGLTQAQFRQTSEYRLMRAVLGSDSAVFACIAQSGSTSCGAGSERSDTLKAALDDYYGDDAQAKDKALNDIIAGRTTIEDVARASAESATLGRGFGEAATQGRQSAIQDIYNKGPVSAEMASALNIASQLGLSAAELRSLASLPGAQIASEISPAMRRAAMQVVKNPVGLAAAAATIGGLIIYAENNPISSPTTPAPQQPALPGFTPADGKDISPPLTGLPAIDLSGPLVGTFPIADPLPPIIATPLPDLGLTTPPNTGFGDGAEVPNGSVLLNEGSTGPSSNGPSFIPGRSDGGPGVWSINGPFGKSDDQCYQCQITGAPLGVEYLVNNVHFDGYDPKTNTLIDAKRFEEWPLPDQSFSWRKIIDQARRQTDAAKHTGATVQWVVPNQQAADLVKKILNTQANPPSIKISVVPKG